MRSKGTRGAVARLTVLVAVLGLLVVLTGCGGDESSDASAQDSAGAIPDSQPALEVPPTLPPKKIVVKELSKGTGAVAKKGDEVGLQYYCIIWETGTEYANSFRYSGVPKFVLGKRLLLRGLNVAVPGMQEGGGREVLIPSNFVYYPGVQHPPLRRLAALICKVYLVEVVDAKSRG